MYKEFDVVLLKSGEKAAIIEAYRGGLYMVEQVTEDGKVTNMDVKESDIAELVQRSIDQSKNLPKQILNRL